jgi:hypothetical protein
MFDDCCGFCGPLLLALFAVAKDVATDIGTPVFICFVLST